MEVKKAKHNIPVVNFGSHLPILIQVMARTSGPTLEMGMGFNSSLFLHWMCATNKRKLVSVEDNPEYFRWAKKFERDFHHVQCVNNWDEADIEHPWDVAFLDHNPAERRVVDIRRLVNFAKYIVIHDAEGRRDFQFHYSTIVPLFRYRYDNSDFSPKTSVLSNFDDMKDLAEYFKRARSEWKT